MKKDERKASEEGRMGPAAGASASGAEQPKTPNPKPETPAAPKPAAGNPEQAAIDRKTDAGQQEMAALLKETESAMFAIRFYPVAVNEQAKDEAVAKLESVYSKGSETVRQMLLYMLHESLATSVDLKVMHTLDYFKVKTPGVEPSQQRMSVYRAIFNYNTSLEGLIELIKLLGRLRGSDDAAKLLTYHFSHLCSYENEASHVLRAAVLGALGESESRYALLALLDYAHYTDNERTFNRVVSALVEWEGKIGSLKMPEKEKAKIREMLKEIITSEFRGSHYG
ncbi:MAG: hypothetical protein AB1529_07805 [Candidatus Micrarchaeota archaeon]